MSLSKLLSPRCSFLQLSQSLIRSQSQGRGLSRCVLNGTRAVRLRPLLRPLGFSLVSRVRGSSGQLPRPTASDFAILRKMLGYVWPEGQWRIKGRVILALACLISAKLINIAAPFLFKGVVDGFNDKEGGFKAIWDSPGGPIVIAAASLVVAYGMARVGTALFNELRNAIFAKVSHNSVRRLAQSVFLHLHSLDLGWHLSRQTGSLARSIDRGSRGIQTVLSAFTFNILPTAFELGLCLSIISWKGGWEMGLATLGIVGLYSTFTITYTNYRTQFRAQMNEVKGGLLKLTYNVTNSLIYRCRN